MMKRSMSYDDSNQLHKKPKHSETTNRDNDLTEKPPTDVSDSIFGKGLVRLSVHLAVSDEEDDDLPYEIAIKSSEISESSRIRNEERLLLGLESQFVVTCYGHEITREKKENNPTVYYNTILEYCPNQCLAKHIRNHEGGGLPENDVKEFAGDILLGLKYIHIQKIIHCDIKPKNILLTPVDKRIRANGFAAKISGFGKAMEKGSIEYNEGCGLRRGTTRFMSPELIRDMVLDYGADVWAFGCTVLLGIDLEAQIYFLCQSPSEAEGPIFVN